MRKYTFVLPFVFLMLGCNDGNDNNDANNECYLPASSDPCFDPNAGGSTTVVTDRTVEVVIAEEKGMPGFEGELDIEDIFSTIEVGPLNCSIEQSQLVIKTAHDWNRFRDSCLFGLHKLPNVDFSNNMVLVSTRDFAEFRTTIEAVLEFDAELVVVIEDKVSDIPPPGPGYPYDIVSVPRSDLPVDFIGVEVFFSPFVQ